MTIVTERLDESLVVASHYFGWSIADVVVTVHRKALSKHPKHTEWPTIAVLTIEQKLSEQSEYKVYNAANMKLNSRIKNLKLQGVNFTEEVRILKVLKERVTKVSVGKLSFFHFFFLFEFFLPDTFFFTAGFKFQSFIGYLKIFIIFFSA